MHEVEGEDRGELAARVTRPIEQWRERVFARLLQCIMLAALLGLSYGLYATFSAGDHKGLIISAIGLGFALALYNATSVSLATRSRLFAVWIVLGSCAGLSTVGFLQPTAFLCLLMIQVLILLLVDAKTAWLTFAASMMGLCAIGIGFTEERLHVESAAWMQLAESANWVRIVVSFAVICAATLACLTYFMRRLEASLVEIRRESEERARALEESRSLQEQLRQAQKVEAIGSLAGGVAHDFNNLLVAIAGAAELVKHVDSREDTLALSGEILDATDRASALTSQLLSFSRHEGGKRTSMSFKNVVTRSCALIHRLLPSSIHIDVKIERELGNFWGAKSDIDQILMNLCINARDAMRGVGSLEIEADRIEDAHSDTVWLRLRVQDSGSGMSEAELQHIFEPFFTTKPEGKGTGLGLAVVQRIVEDLDGRIECSSTPKVGTTFTVRIPEYETASEEVNGLDDEPSLSGSETVLVCDDDRPVLHVMARLLENAGYRVLTTSDPEQALDRVRMHCESLALLVTDAVMPAMNGAELVRRAEEMCPHLRVLVCSGYAPNLGTDFFSPERRSYLDKPFRERAFLREVRRLIDAP